MVKREPDSRGRLPGIGKKRTWGRPIKRRYHGIRKKDKESLQEASTSSSSPLPSKQNENTNKDIEEIHRLIDINILFPQLEKMVCCNSCHGKVKITEFDLNNLGFKIKIICEQECKQETIVNSVKLIGSQCYKNSALALRVLGLDKD